MKTQFQLDVRPTNRQEVQLICNCCGQAYYPNKAWEDRLRAIIFGAEKYANCPSCTQEVSEQVLHDEGYRKRCRDTFTKWRKMFESDRKSKLQQRDSTSEPTYEELKARLAELERQTRYGGLEFRVSERGAVSVYGLGRFPVTLYYEQWVRLLDIAEELREFLETNKAKLKLKGLS